jgi:hypothetical protein
MWSAWTCWLVLIVVRSDVVVYLGCMEQMVLQWLVFSVLCGVSLCA